MKNKPPETLDEVLEIMLRDDEKIRERGPEKLRENISGRVPRLRFRNIPFVKDLDKKILAQAERKPETFQMDDFHQPIYKHKDEFGYGLGKSCGTAHCRAGWAMHFAGPMGQYLEDALGSHYAGALIYARSTGKVPNFYSSNAKALRSLKAAAKRSPK